MRMKSGQAAKQGKRGGRHLEAVRGRGGRFKFRGERGGIKPLSLLLVIAFGGGTLLASWWWANRHAENTASNLSIQEIAIAEADGSPSAEKKTASGSGKQADNGGKSAAAPEKDAISPGAPAPAGPDMRGVLSAAGAARGLQADKKDSSLIVRVYLTQDKRIERAGLETYVKGVVAAEMPTDFKPAALEAQAIAARTYLVRRLWNEDRSGVPVRGADVTDTVTHQVYRSQAQMDKLKENDPKAWAAVDEAVRRTRGIVMVYGGAPIESLYFSSSNGYTENAKDVFNADLPYLVSVTSPWDRDQSPRAHETVEMKLSEFYRKLGVKSLAALTGIGKRPSAVINAWTDGRRVSSATVGGKTLTGTEIRRLLGLRSAAFDWKIDKGKIAITTYGSGHGVGMSQWGAEGMAKAGATASEIVLHYYTGIQLMPLSALQADRSETAKL